MLKPISLTDEQKHRKTCRVENSQQPDGEGLVFSEINGRPERNKIKILLRSRRGCAIILAYGRALRFQIP